MSEKIKVLLSEEEVDSRIKQIAAKVSKDYAGKEIHLICVLKGGVFFTCELRCCCCKRNREVFHLRLPVQFWLWWNLHQYPDSSFLYM